MDREVPSKAGILFAFLQLQQKASTLLFSSEGYKNQGELDAALVAYEQLITTLRRQLELAELNNLHYTDSPFDIPPILDPLLNAMLVQADVFEAVGNLEKGEELREQTILLSKRYHSQTAQINLAEREQQRAASLVDQGRFNEALVALTAARDQLREVGDPLSLASAAANIGGILEWLGDFDRALQEVKRASEYIEPWIFESVPSQQAILSSVSNGRFQKAQESAKILQIWLELEQIRARTYRHLGDFAEAERRFREVIPRVPVQAQPAIEFQFAVILVADGRYEESLNFIERLEPQFHHGLLRPKLGVLLGIKAESLLGLGRPDEAVTILEAAIEDFATYRDPDSLWRVQWLFARALQALNRPTEALAAYAETTSTVNDLRRIPLGYRLDSTYLRDKLTAFDSAIVLACEKGEAETCCRFIEMIKSRTLTATLSIPTSDADSGTADLDRQVEELSRKIDALEYTVFRDGWKDDIEQQRNALLSERLRIMERIRISDPRWRSLSEPVPFNLTNILDLLAKHNQAALTLFYNPPQVITVLLEKGKCTVAAMSVSEEIVSALNNYLQNLKSAKPRPQWYDPSYGLNLDAGHFVVSELLELALKAKSLIVVPHGPLHMLPWAGLTFDKNRLFEYCPVGIVPNLSCISSLQADFSVIPRVALIGAPDYGSLPILTPLHFAPEELHTIRDVYPSPSALIGEILMDREATESNFWKIAQQKDSDRNILHIACHGNFVTGDPMNSGLLMTDAKVDANEIARTDLRYNEVILSACSTGYRPTEVRGVTLSGDDILGLPGAFLEAGVRSVLVSIPRARDDATLAFMTVYHENRAEGKTPLYALQAAQKTMLSKSHYPPHLWIGFTVYGCQ